MDTRRRIWLLFLLLVLVTGVPATASPLTGAFSWQGQLKVNGTPANGPYTLTFDLFDVPTGGTALNAISISRPLTLVNGLVTTQLDFGVAPAQGQQLWLQIRLTDGATNVVLSPRQPVTAGYYALYSLTAEEALVAGPGSVSSASIADGSVAAADLATGSVNSAHIVNASILAQDIAGNTITAQELATGSVGSAEIIDGAVTALDIAANSITAQELATGSVGSAEIIDGTLTALDIAGNTITSQELATASVAAAEIADGSIGTADIGNGAVTGADIADLAITDIDIASNTITGGSVLDGTLTANDLANGAVTSAKVATPLGIGNTNPAYPLDVQGRMRVRGGNTAGGFGGGVWLTDGGTGNVSTTDAAFFGRSLDADNFTGIYSTQFLDWILKLSDTGSLTVRNDLLLQYGSVTSQSTTSPGLVAVHTVSSPLFNGMLPGGRVSFDYSVDGGQPANDGEIYLTANRVTGEREMRLDVGSNAQLRINSNSSQAYLAFNSGLVYKPGGGSWSASSDQRLKHDVVPLAGALDELLQLHGVRYQYRDDLLPGLPKGTQVGFIAQEVQKVFPDWVDVGPGGYLTVGSKGFEARAVEALRELRAEKDAEIAALVEQNAQLSDRLDRLEARILATDAPSGR